MEYKGYNGTISVSDETMTITHSGLVAKTGGLERDVPRNIPLQAVSDVHLKEASRLVNGWLTLGLAGASAGRLGAGTAASDPNTVMFRFKEKDDFQSLYAWLVTVVEQNKTQGVDPTSATLDAAGQTRTERLNERQARFASGESSVARREAQEEKMSSLIGDERPDIVGAAARMGWRMGGKRELKNLATHLHADETVMFIAQGTYDNDQGILVLTDARLLFLFHGMMRQAKEDFPLRLISSVQTKSGLATGEIRIFVSGNSSAVSGIVKSDLEALADAVRQGMAAQHASQAAPPAVQAAPASDVSDPYEALQKLASLRDAGILSDAEFEAKKQELLDRM